MRVLVTVECELGGNTERDRAYGLRSIAEDDHLPYDLTRAGEEGCYSLRQIRVVGVRRQPSRGSRGPGRAGA